MQNQQFKCEADKSNDRKLKLGTAYNLYSNYFNQHKTKCLPQNFCIHDLICFRIKYLRFSVTAFR